MVTPSSGFNTNPSQKNSSDVSSYVIVTIHYSINDNEHMPTFPFLPLYSVFFCFSWLNLSLRVDGLVIIDTFHDIEQQYHDPLH